MPTYRYRCFCLTADNRIIHGLHIDAADVEAAIEAARVTWKGVTDFHSVEVWLGVTRLFPPDPSS